MPFSPWLKEIPANTNDALVLLPAGTDGIRECKKASVAMVGWSLADKHATVLLQEQVLGYSTTFKAIEIHPEMSIFRYRDKVCF